MSIASLLKRLTSALPVILAAAPPVLDAVKQVRKAIKKPKKPKKPGPAGPAAAVAGGDSARPRQLAADSERPAR